MARAGMILAAGAMLAFGVSCGEIEVGDGITEVGALNTAGLALEPTVESTPRADIAFDFTADDASDDSEAATLREGRDAPPDPTATPADRRKTDDDDEEDDDETSTSRTEVEDVEIESEVLIARGTYRADLKQGLGLKVRDEPEGKKIALITSDIAIKATGEGTTLSNVTWAQVRPLGDADWDIGWVVFDHLASGEPDVDPTPTLEAVEQAAPAPTTAPPPPDPDPTTPPAPDPADDDDDADDNEERDESNDSDERDSDDSDEGDSDDADDNDSDSDDADDDSDDDSDDSTVALDSLGDAYTVRDDTDLRDDADPSSSVVAVIRKGADAIVANNTAYRYDGVLYVQVNVVGVLGWVDASQLQEY